MEVKCAWTRAGEGEGGGGRKDTMKQRKGGKRGLKAIGQERTSEKERRRGAEGSSGTNRRKYTGRKRD